MRTKNVTDQLLILLDVSPFHKVTTPPPPVFHQASLDSLPPAINTPELKECCESAVFCS